jgi:hypothetical protein
VRRKVVQYLSRRYCFTAVCVRKGDRNFEATLSRRSPGLAGLAQQEPAAPTATPSIAEDERFSSTSESDAFEACKRRILELGEEILGEVATDEDDDNSPWDLGST